MKIAILTNKRTYEVRRLYEEAKKRKHRVKIILLGNLFFDFRQEVIRIKTRAGQDLKFFDFFILRSPQDLYDHTYILTRYIHRHGGHLLNEETILRWPSYNKFSQHYQFLRRGIPVVPSWHYTGWQLPPNLLKKVKYPLVAKWIYGSRGRQIYKIQTEERLLRVYKKYNKYGRGNLLFQPYWPAKEDFRILTVGKKILGVMKRQAAPRKFITNISAGGLGTPTDLTPELAMLARQTTAVAKCEYAGVDVMYYHNKPYVLENNLFAGFRGFESATGLNVAVKIIEHIEEKYGQYAKD